MVRNVLICTVGVSLLSNLSKPNKDESISFRYQQGSWTDLGRYLAERYPADDRILGAEINSLAELTKKRKVDVKSIWFLLSETADARKMEEILLGYFQKADWVNLNAEDINFVTVEGLQDDDPSRFRGRGLRNLVREMAKIVRSFGPEKVAVDATGGYKAQIALAVVFGQALDIPVYYKHERFQYIIDLPPIVLDFEVLGKYGWLFSRLENNEALTTKEIGELDEEVRVLLNDVKVDGETLWELSPVGQVYLEGFRQKVVPVVELKPALDRKFPQFPDHHRPKNYMAFVEKVWRENPWIYTCVDMGSDGQKGIHGIRFLTKAKEDGVELIGEFRSDYGARFRILVPNAKRNDLIYAALILNERYSKL